MEITVEQIQDPVTLTILRPKGSLDASSYRDLIETGQKAIAQGAQNILLDLSEVPYLSSSGLVALHTLAVTLRGETPLGPDAGWGAINAIHRDIDSGVQQHIKLLSPQPKVDHVLQVAGFKDIFEIYTDQATAIASFGAA